MKILIIDDEPHIRQMMRLTLEAAGYEVGEAVDGHDGLARFADGREWAAVLLDQKMPGLDGLETLRQLKARVPEACVVMVTAFASIELAVDAMRLGATDFLRKPMTPEMLRGAVAAALASRPRTPLKHVGAGEEHGATGVEIVTLNGFRVVRPHVPPDPAKGEHVFDVTHFPTGSDDASDRADRPGGRGPRGAFDTSAADAGRIVLARAGRAPAVRLPLE